MSQQIARNSIHEGRSWSRLPKFSEKWIETVRGSADFLGLNYYTSYFVDMAEEPEGKNPSFYRDLMLKYSVKSDWKQAKSTWLYSVPSGLGDILRWIKKEYNNPNVIITENGWSDDGQLIDDERIDYLRDHLQQILDIISNNECNLKAYTGKS